MLEVSGISARYGNVTALHDVSLTVGQGEIIVLLGVNGAGKSTTLKTISGLLHPARGGIRFEGEAIDRMAPEAIVRRGIAHVPEGRHVFPGLTVRENLVMGTSNRKVTRAETESDIERILEIFPDLKRLYTQMGWSLSGGQQQMLAIGRGLMARPKLLMLDEPSLGLAPVIIKQVFRTIKSINEAGMTILLVEQNVGLSLKIAHRAYLLETGRMIRTDTAAALREDDGFRTALLGVKPGA
ncbi:ABC transporter ATP-binding protein [Acidiphilium sp. PA]|uniref:ABC transporter ATP-binding protein n=1 Tax=Acidiphilium sp. PA TaxID=2871705 RepID=UPI0022440993|nr:ABC transporter ATP-binding protein [Acidiphilium sp. PA]MCW8307912.1 ABC transporter ATP-binding protein [Acidiphilium sp. PA]